jgi:hypothetical protein
MQLIAHRATLEPPTFYSALSFRISEMIWHMEELILHLGKSDNQELHDDYASPGARV